MGLSVLMVTMIRPVTWRRGALVLLDQRLLPSREVYLRLRDSSAVAEAIRTLAVRGAPAIGVAAAFGVALAARRLRAGELDRGLERACKELEAARPTAVNLSWAIQRMRSKIRETRGRSAPERRAEILELALTMEREDVEANRALGRFGAELLPRQATVLTVCNAGALATAGYGTALGVVRAARELGKNIEVVACETRPVLQGARLTAWELERDGIPVTLVSDGAVGAALQRGRVDAVIVGTDRTAANGDVANKVGTYGVAVLAARHDVPFYVAAPTSSIDLGCPTGLEIPIEERSAEEVTHVAGERIAPRRVGVWNPAFDVTPHRLVSAIVTERGIVRSPYGRSLRRLFRGM